MLARTDQERHNECTMRPRLLVLVMAITLGAVCSAEVVRCADAAGNVSYTDGACPAGARPVGRVAILPPADPAVEADRARPSQREPTEAAAPPPPAPAGPIVIDSRGHNGSGVEPAGDSRWSDRGADSWVPDDGYAVPGAYRRPLPSRDMRPRVRRCDEAGCEDRQGNRYNHSGQLERYQSLDGRTCRPVGTTTVCR